MIVSDIWASDASDRSLAGGWGVLPVEEPPLAWSSSRGSAVKSALRAIRRRSSHRELTGRGKVNEKMYKSG